jgi:hypothetical protein
MINETTNERARAEEPGVPNAPVEQLDVEQRGFSLVQSLRNPRTLISFGIAAAIIVFVFRSFDINLAETWRYMREANPLLMLTAFGVFYLTFPMRAIRWRMLLDNAGVPVREGRKSWASYPALIEYIYLSWFANCIVPAKLGDAYRGYLLKRNGQVSFSMTFGTIFAERLLDMLGLFTFLVISGSFVFGTQLPPSTQFIFAAGLVLVAVIVSGLAGMRYFGPLLRRVLPKRLHRMYGQFEGAALRSFHPAILPKLVVMTGIVWLLEGFRLYFVVQALDVEGLHLALPVIIFIALASSLLTAVPLTPAGLGLVEGTVTAVLVLFLPAATALQAESSHSLALAVTFLDRLVNFWSIIVFGLILYIVSKRR